MFYLIRYIPQGSAVSLSSLFPRKRESISPTSGNVLGFPLARIAVRNKFSRQVPSESAHSNAPRHSARSQAQSLQSTAAVEGCAAWIAATSRGMTWESMCLAYFCADYRCGGLGLDVRMLLI